MRRIQHIEITWRYEPPDFFEAPVTFVVERGRLELREGTATLITPGEPGTDARALRDLATSDVQRVFDARSLLTGTTFGLHPVGFFEVDDQGRRGTTIFPDPAVMTVRVFSPSIVVMDSSGAVLADPNADRIRSEEEYVRNVLAKSDMSPLLHKVIGSYTRSLQDPGNALVHLYEVRDAAERHFGDAKSARRQLGLSLAQWRRLGQIANDEPILEGRHRGRTDQPLRSATAEELVEARALAKVIIDALVAVT